MSALGTSGCVFAGTAVMKEIDCLKKKKIDGNLSVNHRHVVKSQLLPQLFDGDLPESCTGESIIKDTWFSLGSLKAFCSGLKSLGE